MCLSAALVGVIAFLRKRSLVGEALAHAAYPGVVIACILAGLFFPQSEEAFSFLILAGAFTTALMGLKTIEVLKNRLKVPDDAALCLVLSVFFGAALLVASAIQTSHAGWYRKAQLFLYGQAATMTDLHIWIYGSLALFTLIFILAAFRHLEAVNFDRDFSETLGIQSRLIDAFSSALLTLAVVIGIRSVGVVLMAGMLIAPAAAARPLSGKLSHHFFFAAIIGLLSGFFGNFISIVLPRGQYTLPTGPMILLSASCLCVLSLLLSPQRGVVPRFVRALSFRASCAVENGLKALWHHRKVEFSFWTALLMRAKGWIKGYSKSSYRLTACGQTRAERIVRLHRLWEVYLVDYMGQKVEKVHRNAEELEHLLTPELERQLTALLDDPKHDPHRQPIPPSEGT